MDYREKVFEMLGVKPEEEFYLKLDNGRFVKTARGGNIALYELTKNLEMHIFSEDGFITSAYSISDLLLGNAEIVKIPKEAKPTKDEQIAIDYARLCGCKWLAQDRNGKVYAYEEKPVRFSNAWYCNCGNRPIGIPVSFLSWEDSEPYYIGGDEK